MSFVERVFSSSEDFTDSESSSDGELVFFFPVVLSSGVSPVFLFSLSLSAAQRRIVSGSVALGVRGVDFGVPEL